MCAKLFVAVVWGCPASSLGSQEKAYRCRRRDLSERIDGTVLQNRHLWESEQRRSHSVRTWKMGRPWKLLREAPGENKFLDAVST